MNLTGGILSLGRSLAESLMDDTCIVRGPAESVWDETTKTYSDVFPISYEGPCRVKFSNSAVQDIESVDRLLTGQRATLSLPVATSGAVRKDHVATLLVCVNDPTMVGTKLRVEGGHHQTTATARRFPVKETT